MKNPFHELGVSMQSTADEIHDAYIKKVKQWHPDNFQDAAQQNAAQDMLCRLNLAYKEAINIIRPSEEINFKDRREHIKKLLKLKQYNSALLYLNKDSYRDAEWYFIYGSILMEQRCYKEAHDCFRMAITTEPNQKEYRQAALNAALLLKKSGSLLGKMSNLFKKL